MDEIIIFETDENKVGLCWPTDEALETYTMTEIAFKDIPIGAPFWIINKEYIPTDFSFSDSWEFDFEALGEPTGYGMDYESWEKEYKK
jgi:hypothetical protein